MGEKPKWFEGIDDTYRERADYLARLIVSRSAGSLAAVLSLDALKLLQEDPWVKPFWREAAGTPGEIEPLESLEAVPASLYLHVGHEVLTIERTKGAQVQPKYHRLTSTKVVDLQPGATAIIKSREYVGMPPFLAGLLVSPVGAAMNGLSNISTMLDPMFQGFFILTFVNLGLYPVQLRFDDRVSRVVFYMVAPVDIWRAELYERSHQKRMQLVEIIRHRVDDGARTLGSHELRAALQAWASDFARKAGGV